MNRPKLYSQVPNNFSICSNPPDLIKTPRLLILRKLTFSTNPSCHFLSLLVLFTPNFHGKIAYCCIYFSFMLYDNLFLFFSSSCNHLKPFLKFRPPPSLLIPRLLNFGFFSDPLFIRTSRLFGTSEYVTVLLAYKKEILMTIIRPIHVNSNGFYRPSN